MTRSLSGLCVIVQDWASESEKVGKSAQKQGLPGQGSAGEGRQGQRWPQRKVRVSVVRQELTSLETEDLVPRGGVQQGWALISPNTSGAANRLSTHSKLSFLAP